ncbi:unnamed protein product [Brachionus calyciflorus]|uniref:Septin-type G domain-containing protein n=1 Tax=Brachionus calyciflorus TaxID=104777 RepID=A0A814E112_9BILA|nr:unnamed protein product [Brachionus calyciflorus]
MALRRLSTRKRRTKVEHVGFSSLPEQVHRKSLKKGFEFTLLVVGDTGLGKSTLVNSLFMTDLYSERILDEVTEKISKTISITTRTAELEEKGVKLKLTVVDTPGFGDSLNTDESWKKISEYIDQQFYSYYLHESSYGIERKRLQDTRIHCCLYFLPPYVRGLRPIDIETMKCLQSRVNIVPVIGKADALTKKELETLKNNILNDIDKYDIKIYEFPVCDSDDDEDFKKLDNEIKNAIPFGIIGSNTVMEVGGKRIRGRAYPWGIIDIESDCCDFAKLRTFLCSSHMQDLKDLTHDIHYENYRTDFLKSQNNSLCEQISDQAYKPRENKLRIDETDKLLQQKDNELKKLQELIVKMKQNLNTKNEILFVEKNFAVEENSKSEEILPVILPPEAIPSKPPQVLRTFGKSTFTIANANCAIINRALNKNSKSSDFCLPSKNNTINYNFKPQSTNFQNLNNYQTSSTAI